MIIIYYFLIEDPKTVLFFLVFLFRDLILPYSNWIDL